MKNEEDYLLLSQLTHAGYCLRRAALVMNEQLWNESVDTVKGRQEHMKVHDRRIERRGNEIKLYEYEVISHDLMIRGKCDCIEAVRDDCGCRVPFSNFPVLLKPVEFKHGRVREEEEYDMQLCAQAMCLEEMYKTNIEDGDIFYVSSHKRHTVLFTEELRQKTKDIIKALQKIRSEYSVPPAEYGAKCKKCSLAELCMPKMKKTAAAYCKRLEEEAMEVEFT